MTACVVVGTACRERTSVTPARKSSCRWSSCDNWASSTKVSSTNHVNDASASFWQCC